MTRDQRENRERRYPWDEALAAKINELIKLEELSQTALAKQIGVGAAVFNQWLQGKYTGNNEKVQILVMRWLDARDSEQELKDKLPPDLEWVRTPSANAVSAALGFSQMAGAISVIYGGAGMGKSTAIRVYQRRSPNVWVVTATPTVAMPGPIILRIASTLGTRTTGQLHQVEKEIVDRVRDTRGLLVIDEAQHLSHRALDAVRSIHDATGIGVVLCGNEIVYAQLTGGNRAVGFAQLFSRVAKRVRLSKPQPGDIDSILDAWGITDNATRKFCHGIGMRPGALRGLNQTIRLATLFANNAGKPLSLGIIRDAWADLGGEL